MNDLASEMAALGARLGPPPFDRARVVQFVAPDARADAAPIARAFALEMARTAKKGVWLLDLDPLKSAQHAYFDERQNDYGPLGPPARAAPGEVLYFTVAPKDPRGPFRDEDFIYAQAVGRRRLWVTRFRREALSPGQTVQILADGAYLDALRPHADYIVLEAPAFERSPVATATAPCVDDNLIVMSARSPDTGPAKALRTAIEAVGGRCAGVVLTDAPQEPPAFLQRLAP